MRATLLTCSLAMLALGGCLDAQDGTPHPGQANPETPETPDTLETQETPDTPDTPEAPNPPLAWCLPAAVGHSPSLNLPEVPPEALELTCGLAEEVTTNASSTRRVTYTWVDDTLVVRYPAGGYANLLKLVFVDGVRVEARYGTAGGGGASTEFTPFGAIDRFRWDAAGHLIELARLEDGVEDVFLTQTWDGGRLVARSEQRNVVVGEALTRETLATRWSYDDAGRLARADADGYGHAWQVRWTYDDAGRPSRVERDRDGQRVERQTWTYGATGALAARTVFVDRTHDSEDGFSPTVLDDLGTAEVYDWLGNPWEGSLPRDRGACRTLPNTLQHGYPAGEREYDLGTPRDERPNGIGWAYGNNSYGWNYGDLAWYSHAGIHGFEPNYFWYLRVDATISYDAAERMVHEVVSGDGGSVLDLARTRTFEGPRMTTDRMTLSVVPDPAADAPGELVYDRELRFTWLGDDLIARDLVDDVAGLLEQQTWTYDAAGRWASHEVSRPAAQTQIYSWQGAQACEGEACLAPLPELWRRYEREVDAAGRTTLLRESYLGAEAGSVPPTETRWSYDEAGRLVSRTVYGTLEGWQYDAEGRLVLETWDNDHDGQADDWRETEFDAAGRWVATRSYNSGSLNHSVVRTFACE